MMRKQPGHDDRGPEPGDPTAESLRRRAEARVRRRQAQVQAGLRTLEARRGGSPAIDFMFNAYERDRDIHAGTLAGALAFRLFLFLLPLTLVIVVVLGFAISNDASSSQDLIDRFGLRGALANALVEAADQGRANRWYALAIGLFGTAWGALGAVRTIRLVHFLAWDQPPTPLRGAPRAVGAFVGANVLIIGTPLIAEWVRAFFGLFGSLAGLVGVFLVYCALWVLLSAALPHRDAPVRFLVPGAILVAAGTHVLHLFTVYLFGPRLEHTTSVYGSIGVAIVMLTWLFIVARLIVGSAVVNAVLDERRAVPSHGESPHEGTDTSGGRASRAPSA